MCYVFFFGIMELLLSKSVLWLHTRIDLPRNFIHSFRWYFLRTSVQFSHSVMSNSLWPHGLQHTKFGSVTFELSSKDGGGFRWVDLKSKAVLDRLWGWARAAPGVDRHWSAREAEQCICWPSTATLCCAVLSKSPNLSDSQREPFSWIGTILIKIYFSMYFWKNSMRFWM